MNIARALTDARIDRCDGEILMGFTMKKDRSWVVAHGDVTLTPKEQQKWNTYRQRREKHEPIAYITGEKEFFGRSFHVDRSVLIPRPSTEGLVAMVLDSIHIFGNAEGQHSLPRSSTPRLRLEERGRATRQNDPVRPPGQTGRTGIGRGERGYGVPLDAGIIGISDVWGPLSDVRTIVDVGTGSGCIAVTLACELPELTIIATDTSAAALNIAQQNAKRHDVADRIHLLHGNLLEPVCHPQPFLLVSNPPYIPETEKLPIDVTAYEPATALYAGPDGLAVLAPLIAAAHAHPACRGYVIECRECAHISCPAPAQCAEPFQAESTDSMPVEQ